jgi:outer membrane protein OmpA-like peptidoglycan-associated protein
MVNRLFKTFIALFGVLILSSCVNTPTVKAPKKVTKKKEYKVPLSNRGKYLYSMLLDKQTGEFIKEHRDGEPYDTSKYEVIKVYNRGAYPSYHPSEIQKHQDSLFKDRTFDSIKTTGTILTGLFDEQKFIRIANKAIKRMKEIEAEKYSKVKFDIDFRIDTSINEEYATATILIHHRPSLQLKRAIFYVNGSAMYNDRLSSVDVSPILRKETYKVGLPTGKNRVKVQFLSLDGKSVDKMAMVENLFKGRPTFHIVAIGINKFPNWTIDRTLKNAVNDANLIKKILTQRSQKLFDGRVKIKPYVLDAKSTTKESISKLIEEVRKNVKPNDYFLLYVASHGVIKGEGDDKKYYFAPSDFSIDPKYWSFKNGFKENQISEYLINIPSIFRIAILDTCYAGREVDSIKKELQSLPFGKRDGISVLTATKSTQEANDNYKGHGLFTYILAEGLNGKADYNKDGVVDSIEIAQYVKSNVSKVSRRETNLIQDSLVLPEPMQNYNRRFELTLLEKRKAPKLRPNVFTPRESQLYIDAIKIENASMMNGIIRNNIRHNTDEITESVDASKLSKEELINKLASLGSVDVNIHFAVNSDKLTSTEIVKLDIIAKALQSNELKDKQIFIEGHTDSDGEEESNMDLSQRRANSVTKLLADKFGIKSERLTSLGFGEIYPVADNSTTEGKAKNRRVSIFIYE